MASVLPIAKITAIQLVSVKEGRRASGLNFKFGHKWTTLFIHKFWSYSKSKTKFQNIYGRCPCLGVFASSHGLVLSMNLTCFGMDLDLAVKGRRDEEIFSVCPLFESRNRI